MPYEYTVANLSQKTFNTRREAVRAARGVGAVLYVSAHLRNMVPSATVAVLHERAWDLDHLPGDLTERTEDLYRWGELWRDT